MTISGVVRGCTDRCSFALYSGFEGIIVAI